LNRLTLDHFESFRQRATLNPKKSALESWVATIRTEDMGKLLIHWILTRDVAAGIAFVKRQCVFQLAAAVEHPTAQRGLREPAIAEVLIAQLLKPFISLLCIVGPVNMEAHEPQRKDYKRPTQRTQASIRRSRPQPFLNFIRNIVRDSSGHEHPSAAPHKKCDQQE
jgi:hypothetical protein